MILVIDNYDSFTYNLVQYLGEIGEEVIVRRNDEIDLAGVEALAPDHILISPGPCTPREAGCCACRSASPYNLGVEWVPTRAYVEAATAHKPAW